jgi:predicted phage tail protein
MGFPGMGYRGWRRGMYGPMGGRPTGAFIRRRAITHTLLGALLLAIGIVVTVVNLNTFSGGAGIVYVPWFLIVIGALWFFGGLSMLARTSRFR